MSHARVRSLSAFMVAAAFAALLPLSASAGEAGAQTGSSAAGEALLQQTIGRYCATCHNERLQTAGLVLTSLDLSEVGAHAETWEKVITKLRTRTMPPVGRPRPATDTYDVLAGWLENEIDRFAGARPNPGRTEAFHRLNRAEYANAIRDLLALDVDVTELLPADDFDEYGFDNMADILTVSPALMERYLSAARKIGRLAVGETPLGPATDTYDVPILLMQDDRMGDDVPFGSRGGIGIRHYFPVDGEYDVEIRLHRNYVNYVRGMGSRHELEVRLDGVLVRSFVFGGEEPEGIQAPASYGGNQFGDPEWEEYMLYADANMRARFQATAGPHVVSVAFVRRFTEPEGVLQPRQSIFAVAVNEMRDGNAAVEHVAVGGPYISTGPGNTPARQALFTCRPASDATADEEACAEEILSSLARRAYRRTLEAGDVATLMDFYRAGRDGGSFDAGIQLALERVLISPDFLFRVERDPIDIRPGASYALNDTEIASRLSYFIWSSGPDEELLDLAEQGRLNDPEVLAQQARRMLADPRSKELVRNFAGQWLYLRNLRGVVPDAVVFPEFDENLRDAFLEETELFVESLIREDRSVLDLLGADYTYVNERLAEHYGIPNVYGSQFRRVTLPAQVARAPRRHLRPRQPADRDLVPQPDVAGAARQVGAGEHPRNAAAAAARRRARSARPGRGRPRRHRAGPLAATPRESRLLGLPRADGPARAGPGELRRGRQVARDRRGEPADRRVRQPARRDRVRGSDRTALAAPRAARAVHGHLYGEAPRVCARAGTGVLRPSHRARHHPFGRLGQLPLVVNHHRNRAEHAVPHAEV